LKTIVFEADLRFTADFLFISFKLQDVSANQGESVQADQ